MSDLWTHNEPNLEDEANLSGYDVQATDGSIGKIGDATNEAGSAHVVVDTGFWIFGKKRLIPAGALTGVDHEAQEVMVDMTKDQIKEAPDFEQDRWEDDTYRSGFDDYYGPYM